MTLPWRELETEIIDALRQQGIRDATCYSNAVSPNSIYRSITSDICLVGTINLTELAKAIALAGFGKAGVVSMKVDP